MKTKKTKKKVKEKKIKEKPIKVKEVFKHKKKKTIDLPPERLGVEHCYEVLKTDKDGNELLSRTSKYVNGKLVMEMLYNYSKNEIEYKVREF